jgi:membrane protein
MHIKDYWTLLKDAGSQWLDDKAPRLGAALAYYTIFSIAPLLVIAIGVIGFLFGRHEAVQQQIVGQIKDLVGGEGGKAIETMVASASHPGTGILGTILGVVMLLFGAISLFGQLQDALNTIWGVEPKPGRGLLGMLKDRLLSFSMVLGTVFLLLVSLIVSAALAAVGRLLGDWQSSLLGEGINLLVSLVVITLLFAMIFRFLPDAKVAWRDVWLGAGLTTVLFAVGKFVLGLYLGRSGTASAYGAVGSLAVLLIWIYYSAQIFLFGAELTKAYANRFGSRIVPSENARPVTAEARAEQGLSGPSRSPANRPETAHAQ